MMIPTLVPNNGWVIAEPIDGTPMRGLILLTDPGPPTKARVVALNWDKRGRNGKFKHPEVMLNDIVRLPKGIGQYEVKMAEDGKRYMLLLIRDIQLVERDVERD